MPTDTKRPKAKTQASQCRNAEVREVYGVYHYWIGLLSAFVAAMIILGTF